MGTEYTITAGQRRKQYTVGGSNQQGPYSFPFEVLATTDVTVYVGDTKKTLTTHYTVSIASNNTCTVTFAAGQYPSQNDVVTIHGGKSVGRTTNFTTAGQLTAAGLNAELGRDVILHQQVDERVDRCLQLKPTVVRDTSPTGAGPVQITYDATASNNANKTLVWDGNGTAIVNSDFTAGTMATQSASSVNIDGGAVDGTTIGANSAAAGTFTTLTATTSNLGTLGAAVNANNQNITNIDVDSGAVDGTTIGAASAAAGTFTTATATTKVVTPEVEMSGSTLLVDAASGTLDMDATTLDVDATTTCEIDNSNTTNGVKLGTNTSSGKVYIGHTTSETTVNDNLTVTGNLTVQGDQLIANTATLEVEDHQVIIGKVTTPSDATANNGGVLLKGSTDKSLLWDNANDNWTSNQHLNISTGKEFKINNTKVLDATSLGSAVVGTSITSTGTIASGTWQGTAVAPQYGGTGQNFSSSTGAIQVSSGTVSAGTLPVSMGGTGQTSWTDGQLAIGVSSGNTLAKGTLTAGTGISVTNAGGSITIANTGNAAQADMNGSELVLDTDGDTSITADTDDQIDIKISGADDFQFTANTFTVLSGSTLTIASGATIANSGTATNFDDGTAAAMALALGG
jgi:hypothetical protein